MTEKNIVIKEYYDPDNKNMEGSDYPESEYDKDSEKYRFYKKIPLSLSDEEWEAIYDITELKKQFIELKNSSNATSSLEKDVEIIKKWVTFFGTITSIGLISDCICRIIISLI